MVRVLLVGKGHPDTGGIPAFLQTLLGSDLADRHTLRFLNLARPGDVKGGRLSAQNIVRTAEDVAAVWRAAHGADVVHLHTALAPTVTAVRASLLAAAARGRGARVLLHAHGGIVALWMDRPWRHWLLRAALTPVDRVITVSAAVRDRLAGVIGDVQLIDNGVDTETFTPTSRTNAVPRILFVGGLTPRKGVLDLFEASRLLSADGVEHQLELVGGRPDEGSQAEQAVRVSVPATASLLGARPIAAMPEAYADADIFCLPSWWEAMPLSVLEAMACGVPVVSTDVGDVARLLDHGAAGLVVPPKAPQQLAAALRKLVDDPQLRRSMGAAGRRRVESFFSRSRLTDALDCVYRELAGA